MKSSPCIGLCSTTFGDNVCLGCQRFRHEIIGWNQYLTAEKTLIWQRIEQTTASVLKKHLDITDSQTLKEFLKQHSIRFVAEASPYHWVVSLLHNLNKGSRTSLPTTTDSQAQYGIVFFPPFANDPAGIWQHIKMPLMTLSNALYELQQQKYPSGKESGEDSSENYSSPDTANGSLSLKVD